MTLEEPHEQLHEAHTDSPTEQWASSIPQLRDEISTLTELLATIATEETDSQEQLESLTYALGLTKGEIERRQRSNNELSSAYESHSPQKESEVIVQKLEGELLNAKRDSANMEYEVERLEFRLKKLHEETGVRDVTPVVSPRISMRSPVTTSSPQLRQGRLIGDVDAVVRLLDTYIPCRLGVSVGGGLAIYSYVTPEAILHLSEQVYSSDLTEEDFRALTMGLRSVDVQLGDDGRAVLLGLEEGVNACVQIINDG